MKRPSLRRRKREEAPGKDVFDRGLELYEEGEYEDAIHAFSKAAKNGFSKDSAENNIGACYERMNRWSEARAHYSASLITNPNNPFALKNMGTSLLSDGLWVDARKLFSQALTLNPGDHEIRLGLARSLMHMNRMSKGVRVLEPIFRRSNSNELIIGAMSLLSEVGAYDALIEFSNDLPKEIRKNDEILQMLGEAFLERGLQKDAIDCFRKLMEIRGDAVSKSWLGLALVAIGDEEVGLKQLDEAVTEAREDPIVLQNFVFALHGSDRLAESIPIYEKLLEMSPNDWILWNNLGNALYNMGKYGESIPKFVTALEKNYDYEIAWNNIGNAFEKMGLYPESIPFHQRAIEIDWNFDYAHIALAEALFMLGRHEKAEKAVDRAIALGSVCAESWQLKAKIAMRSSSEEAMTYAENAMMLEPESAEPLVLYAMCQELAGQSEEAARALRRARKLSDKINEDDIYRDIERIKSLGSETITTEKDLDERGTRTEYLPSKSGAEHTDSPTFWYNMGLRMLNAGNKKRAISAFRMALDIDPDSPAATAMLIRLEESEGLLKDYLKNARRLISDGLATPKLEESMDMAKSRMR